MKNKTNRLDIFDTHKGVLPKKTKQSAYLKNKVVFGLLLSVPVLVAAIGVIYLVMFGSDNVKAQAGRGLDPKLFTEFRKEQELLEQEKQRLQQYEASLRQFEAELDQKTTDLLAREKDLIEKEEAFNKKMEGRIVDRQVIETYENIDPEQAAVLMQNLYKKDNKLAVLVIRKLAGKKSGKILEAMIPINPEIATALAKEALDYYKPGNQK